ncbi:EAL domain-containing protein, partial [Sulfurovum sp. bin170]|uniref:bifunctional diguanylate cyclase/phosphodiesterase n=1 Tax=Sulfurovum sp. bin170 TaxID=2695268 RepID=UPI0013E0C522
DISGVITYVNDEFCRVSGFSRDELIGKSHNIIRSPDVPKEFFLDMWDTIKKRKKRWQGIVKNRTKDGKLYYVKAIIQPIFNLDGKIEEFIASRTLITDIINPQKQLMDFLKPMDESLVVLIKIEDIKYLSCFLDRELNEEIQEEFAGKLFDLLPQECNFFKIYLLEDGEFAIAKDKSACIHKTDDIIKRVKEFQERVNYAKINMRHIDYDLSIVISLAYGRDALWDAKIGLKELLKTKQNFIVANGIYRESQERSKRNIETFKMIKRAIDSYNIVSYFQPIVNNRTKKIEKYESLVRLIDDNSNIVSPYHFLEVSKKGKYYSQITFMVLENSFKALHETGASISINFSALDIEKTETRERFIFLLKENKLDAHRVTLELVEDEDISDFNLIRNFIKEIKSLGVKVAIDDFGVGYSNFERVLEYKPNFLKIDGRLIRNLSTDKFAYSIVEAIVSFAKKENLQTIAEYVESEEIYDIICQMGVDYSQGYYFGKPDILQAYI